VTASEIRRAALDLPLPARRDLVAALDADLRLDERVIDQAAWFSHRLEAAHCKREQRTRSDGQQSPTPYAEQEHWQGAGARHRVAAEGTEDRAPI
jgi:hypothetical protein